MKENIKIVWLGGGIGNQLFQYAFARALEELHGIPVYLDESYYKNIVNKNERWTVENIYASINCLDKLNLNPKYATAEQLQQVENSRHLIFPKFIRKILKLPDFHGSEIREIIPQKFVKSFLWNYKNVKYVGYYHNYNYFKGIDSLLRKEIFFSDFDETDNYNKEWAEKITQSENPVFLHVRRGDYVNLGWELSIGYYRNACAYIVEHVKNPKFFVFSDDYEYVKKNLTFGYDFEFIGDENFKRNQDYHDMHLMSLCRHAVIANSSFSWWGAWLMANKEKIVVAPTPWFKYASARQTRISDGIICDNWVKINADEERRVI